MSNLIVSLILAVVLLTGVSFMAQGSLRSVDLVREAWQEMEERSGDISRTAVEVLGTTESASYVQVTLRNTGQIPLRDFESWDAFVEYFRVGTGEYQQRRLQYSATAPPGYDQWAINGIYKPSLRDCLRVLAELDNMVCRSPSEKDKTALFSLFLGEKKNGSAAKSHP